MDKKTKETYVKLLRWQKQNRVIAEYSVQDMPDGSLRVAIQPLKPPEFVYTEFRD